MDLSMAKQVLDTLYQEIQGYDLSFTARKKLSFYDRGLTYGEIVLEPFYEILSWAAPQTGEVFYDLGSGSGKAVFAAALLFPFLRVVGVEVLDDLYEASLSVLQRFQKMETTQITFIHDDFLNVDFSDADILFAHATCFHDGQLKQLTPKLEQLKKGTRMLVVSKSISAPSYRLVKSDDYQFSWGKATLHFYEKAE